METVLLYEPTESLIQKAKLPKFVYVGRLSEEKGIDVIFKAFQIQNFDLIIIGDGPLRGNVEAFVRNNPEVEYLGFQNKDTIRTILKTCSALLFCSKCYENMPMTILEAFSSGIPVIAAALGSIPDIVSDEFNGLLFKNDDAKDLSYKIQRWMNFPPYVKERFNNNSLKTFNEKFSTEKNFNQLLDIYIGLLH